ncbi:MAG: rod shape-determining protein MreC, partial [Pseudomonadota bacterium]
MTRLRDDTFQRRGKSRPRRRYVGAVVFALIFVSIALLVLSRLDHPYVAAMRSAAAPVLTPVLTALSGPLAPVRRLSERVQMLLAEQDEIERLRAEIQQLRGWQWKAEDLQRQLNALSALAKREPDAEIPFITARVIADSRGPFARSVVIDAGSDRGLKEGHPVISADGMVGRLVDVTPAAARVLLVTDFASRIPVEIGNDRIRAIATGTNGPRPRLKFLPRDAVPKVGDVVATSGRGGLFPRAL